LKHGRLFAIVNLLLARGRTPAPELARAFEVSVRTIYRDLETLSGHGVPVVAIPGAGGGYEVAEGFRIDRSFLSGEELADLTGALEGFAEALKDVHLERSLGKLASLGSRPGAARRRDGGTGQEARSPADCPAQGCSTGRVFSSSVTGAPAPPLQVTLTPWGGPSPDAATVELFRVAIAARQVVSVRYQDSRGSETERSVEPFSVVLGGAVWYVHAYCRLRGAFRLFRLSRVRDVAVLGETFDPWRRAPVPKPFAGAGNEVLVDVVVRAAASRRAALVDAFGAAAVADAPDGRVVASFRTPADEWLPRFVLSLGPGVEVLEPAALREQVREAARAVAEANQ
jgi:predicted DNA-binding transcriptional regulator YafY